MTGQKIFFNPIAAIVITLVCGAIMWSLYSQTKSWQQSNQTLVGLRDNISGLEGEINDLENKLDTAQTDFAKEKIVRNELLMQKPGEYVVQLPELAATENPAAAASPTPTPWQAWQNELGW